MADGGLAKRVFLCSLFLLLLLLSMLQQTDSSRPCYQTGGADADYSLTVAGQVRSPIKDKDDHWFCGKRRRRKRRKLSSSSQVFVPRHGRPREMRYDYSDHEVPSGPNPISNR
eukprot:TRINITY_DN10842_c0_g1_i1.p1 TRINITY_DN10842_c0_g1~~TRINITY_DN10842_c0_g1_i1.p1  ORF type:complete len:126 (+),score=16.26 TRINITY_DN10842_c0_g1_i1:40-378(+)